MACQKKNKKRKERERGNTNTHRERETPHCKQGTGRAGVHFPFPKVFSVELNKCRPFLLRLSPPLEDNPESELFADVPVPFLTALLGDCVLSPFACIPTQDVPPGLTFVTGFTGSLLAAAGRSLSPPHRSHQLYGSEETKPPSFINCHGNQVPSMKQAWFQIKKKQTKTKKPNKIYIYI